jgi:hypothetical protein
LTLFSQYKEGSIAGGQGNDAGGTLSNAELWRMYWSGVGAGSSSSSCDEGSLADDPTISAQYTGGSGIGRITPLVYNPQNDGPPVFHSGVWTGDLRSVQFVQTADTGNQGTGEGEKDPLELAYYPKKGLRGFGPRVEGGVADEAFGQVGGRTKGVLWDIGIIVVTEGGGKIAGFWWFVTKGDDAAKAAGTAARGAGGGAVGLKGVDFEDYIKRVMGGSGNFKAQRP